MAKLILVITIKIFILSPLVVFGHGNEVHCKAPKCPVKDSTISEIQKSYRDSGVSGLLGRKCASCHDSSLGPWDEDGTKHLDIGSFPLTGHHGQSFVEVLCHLKKTVEGKTKNPMPKDDKEFFNRSENAAIKSTLLNWIDSSIKDMNNPDNQNCSAPKPVVESAHEGHHGDNQPASN